MSFFNRSTQIAELAAAVDARMDATETPAGSAEPGTSTPPAPESTPTPAPAETATDPARPNEGTDWQALARKHEDRAKANKAAAEKAAEEKAAADQARAEAEQARQQADAKQQDFMKGLAKLLGYEQSDSPPDPAALQQEIAARDTQVTDLTGKVSELEAKHAAQLRERDVELAAWRAATKNGVNAAQLLNRRDFAERTLPTLDPSTEQFAETLEAAIKQAAKDDPTLLVTPPVAGAAEAGIGAVGAGHGVGVTPGIARLRAAYS